MYVFDNAAPIAGARLAALAAVYDPGSIRHLAARGVARRLAVPRDRRRPRHDHALAVRPRRSRGSRADDRHRHALPRGSATRERRGATARHSVRPAARRGVRSRVRASRPRTPVRTRTLALDRMVASGQAGRMGDGRRLRSATPSPGACERIDQRSRTAAIMRRVTEAPGSTSVSPCRCRVGFALADSSASATRAGFASAAVTAPTRAWPG